MDYIIEETIERSKIAILKCSEDTLYPKAHMDALLLKYVEGELYNSFMDKNLDNPYIRVVIRGINEFDWVQLDYDKTDFDESLLGFYPPEGKIAFILFFIPSLTNNPANRLDELFQLCQEKDSSCTQYIDTHMDNPYVRLIIRGINNLNFKEFTTQRLSE